jgi:hypothetical protein
VWPWRTHVTCCGAATHIFLQPAPGLLIFLKVQASKVIEFRTLVVLTGISQDS